MSRVLASLVFLVAATSVVFAGQCKVTNTAYTAGDGTVLTDAAYVISFTADCPDKVVPAYANLNGRTLVVVRSDVPNQYQVSWTTDINKAGSGSYDVSIFDEEGFQQFKKSQRSGYGDAKNALFSVPFSHYSPYRGPLIQGEVVALAIGFILTYYALVLRFQIQAKKI